MVKYLLVLNIGTYCDHFLIEKLVSPKRKKYKLVVISNKKKGNPLDINIYHDTDKEILNKGSDMVTYINSKNNWWYFIENFNLVGLVLSDFWNFRQLLEKTIDDYQPVKIMSHCGNFKDLVYINRQDIPTTFFYFSPGFLPNYSIPFVFDNSMKNPNTDIYNKKDRVKNNDSIIQYYNSIVKICNLFGKSLDLKGCLKYLTKVKHVMCFNDKLVPAIDYSLNLSIKNIGLIRYQTSKKKLPETIVKWVKSKKVIFVSFGSYFNEIINQLYFLISEIKKYCRNNNYYAIIQIPTNYDLDSCNRILVYNKYINYQEITPLVKLVIFSGSIGLQSVCLRHSIKMLFIPYLPEQFFWAKLYKYHTNIDYIDSNQDNEITFIQDKIRRSLDAPVDFYRRFNS